MLPAGQRVVIADDSAFMRRILETALTEAGFSVVGLARDGDEALALCRGRRPDILSLDLAMPGLDGLGVLRALRAAQSRIAVVVVSAFSPQHGARAVDALAEGAFDLVAKPSEGRPLNAFVEELGQKTRAAAIARLGAARRVAAPAPAAVATPLPEPRPARGGGEPRLVVVACSTGGPQALGEIVPKLPGRLGIGTLIVQHMPAGFTTSLAARLDRTAELTVREAAPGDRPRPGEALIAPGGSHLRLAREGRARLSDEPAVGGLRPRADLTIKDAAAIYEDRLLLVVLTGMGRDGLEGAREVHRRGGRILVEDESTCTVYGMPRAVAEARLADAVLPRPELPAAIAAEAGESRVSSALRRELPDEYTAFCEGVRGLARVDLLQYKRGQMERRIRSFAGRIGITDLGEYLDVLKSDPARLDQFLDRITINVSQLWRNPAQWTMLAERILPELAASGRIRAWSAGCSYGAEAFTLAAIARTVVPTARLEIRGTDIDARMVERARAGRFSVDDARDAPPRLLARWFAREGDEWVAKPELRLLPRFDVGDLLRMTPPGAAFDLVLCRNTVIYFDEPVRNALHARLATSLRPGGYLFVGSTERVAAAGEIGLEPVQPFVYRKR